ncbi:hypothetical protein ACLOJK_006062 [Asimina triloba]
MELTEGVGESSSPPRAFGAFNYYDVRNDVYNRLMENGNEEAVSNPRFREQLDAHFSRLPPSYGLDVNVDRAEDVLMHQKILAEAKDPEKRPVFHVRFVETRVDGNGDVQESMGILSTSRGCSNTEQEADTPSNASPLSKTWDREIDFEPCSKLEDLNLEVGKNAEDVEERNHTGTCSGRQDVLKFPVHEIVFSTIDKPKLLSQLSALLSDIGLNIREAHVFSTTDGYSLDVFVIDGWPVEDTDGLHKALEKAIAGSEGSWSGSSPSHSAIEKALSSQPKFGDWEIDRRFLNIGEKIASGSCGDLHRGFYLGHDVAVKVLRSEHLNEALEVEFAQEVRILREIQHKNVVRFIGACTKLPDWCIVTGEKHPCNPYYASLHSGFNAACCLWDAPLTMSHFIQVVKVADFGVARFQSEEGVMTAETGTYRWMAPEVINHQPYDKKADVFSFAIVLWELVTAKIPYDNMTPLQAALGVRQGLRPVLPDKTHPQLLDLMQRCWEAAPANRPSFSQITVELEELLLVVRV